ncbi:MAG: PhzF family phenazine biosynthesis protein [Cyanobacteria bacterium J06628_6]
MGLSVVQVDAFTNQPFKGNPAAVCVSEGPVERNLMQAVATEMNLSETAFAYPAGEGYHLRWFTPTTEVKLCGHATLATAHVLWSEGHLSDNQTARFDTLSGELTAQKQDDWIQMKFPAQPPRPATVMPHLIAALNRADIHQVMRNDADYLVVLRSQAAVEALTPNFEEMAKLQARGVIVTSPADSDEYDFVSRFFAPAFGIPEDPVTGSAHCALVPYWAERLGKTEMVAYQASARSGVLKLRTDGHCVFMSGQAVTTLRGELAV